MKLELHLIPETSYYKNLRKEMGPRKWRALSKKIRGRKNFTCELCGAKQGRDVPYTHLHEVWEFDEEKKLQRLIGFECLCPDCHAVHHWGLSQMRGEIDMDALLEHACSVNQCFESVFRDHIREAFSTWRRRSMITWSVDVSLLDTST